MIENQAKQHSLDGSVSASSDSRAHAQNSSPWEVPRVKVRIGSEKYEKLIVSLLYAASDTVTGRMTTTPLPSALPLSNCSEKVVNSHPVELVQDTGGYIIIVYVYAVLVVAATLVLYARWGLNTKMC